MINENSIRRACHFFLCFPHCFQDNLLSGQKIVCFDILQEDHSNMSIIMYEHQLSLISGFVMEKKLLISAACIDLWTDSFYYWMK